MYTCFEGFLHLCKLCCSLYLPFMLLMSPLFVLYSFGFCFCSLKWWRWDWSLVRAFSLSVC